MWPNLLVHADQQQPSRGAGGGDPARCAAGGAEHRRALRILRPDLPLLRLWPVQLWQQLPEHAHSRSCASQTSAFFLRTGSCKFGAGCRYSHDVPGGGGGGGLPASVLAAASGFTGGGFSSGPGGFSDGPSGFSTEPGGGFSSPIGQSRSQDNLDQLCNRYLE